MNDIADIITQARELGKKIAAHPRTREFTAVTRAVAEDRDAQAILKSFQEQMEKIQGLEAGGKPIEVEDKRQLADRQAKVAANDKLKLMLKQQADFFEMMHRINSAIDEASQSEMP